MKKIKDIGDYSIYKGEFDELIKKVDVHDDEVAKNSTQIGKDFMFCDYKGSLVIYGLWGDTEGFKEGVTVIAPRHLMEEPAEEMTEEEKSNLLDTWVFGHGKPSKPGEEVELCLFSSCPNKDD